MANRSINELDDMWQAMRGLAAKYDVKIITATAPRTKRVMPQNENGIIIVDYISTLGSVRRLDEIRSS